MPRAVPPATTPTPLKVATAHLPGSSAGSSHSPAAGGSQDSSGSLALGGARGSLVLSEPGSALTAWNTTASYCPETSGMRGDGTVATDGSDVKLTTGTGSGSCVSLISPQGYSSDVIEADIYFPPLPGNPSLIANWTGFWLTNADTWPQDGELDAVEVQPVNGESAVTWHSGTSGNEFSASTSGFAPVQLPAHSANLTPGWHVVDIVYTKGYFAVYYDNREYSSYNSGNVTGAPLDIYFTMSVTPDTSAMAKILGSPPMNSDLSPATMTVKYLKVWTFR